jgi:hypothetical protein
MASRSAGAATQAALPSIPRVRHLAQARAVPLLAAPAAHPAQQQVLRGAGAVAEASRAHAGVARHHRHLLQAPARAGRVTHTASGQAGAAAGVKIAGIHFQVLTVTECTTWLCQFI